eukprot:scaffold2631_cov412-Prasinococcus_capsulatus_cf.AAC.8
MRPARVTRHDQWNLARLDPLHVDLLLMIRCVRTGATLPDNGILHVGLVLRATHSGSSPTPPSWPGWITLLSPRRPVGIRSIRPGPGQPPGSRDVLGATGSACCTPAPEHQFCYSIPPVLARSLFAPVRWLALGSCRCNGQPPLSSPTHVAPRIGSGIVAPARRLHLDGLADQQQQQVVAPNPLAWTRSAGANRWRFRRRRIAAIPRPHPSAVGSSRRRLVDAKQSKVLGQQPSTLPVGLVLIPSPSRGLVPREAAPPTRAEEYPAIALP